MEQNGVLSNSTFTTLTLTMSEGLPHNCKYGTSIMGQASGFVAATGTLHDRPTQCLLSGDIILDSRVVDRKEEEKKV